MADFYCRMQLQYDTLLPRDVSESSFAFTSASVDAGLADDMKTAVESFWNQDGTTFAGSIGSFLSPVIIRGTNVAKFTIYGINTATGLLGEPLLEQPFDLVDSPIQNVSLPAEVALCTSFNASGSGPARRRRGRMFIGPFNTGALGTATSSETPPAGELMGVLRDATERLNSAMVVWGGQLCVWSRADAELKPVTDGWVDNAWDIQRRRGVDPSARTTWVVGAE